MVVAVRTERRSDGLEIVKQAGTDDDRARLAHEAAMLRRAAHPGVVELVAESPGTLRLRHHGTPLARLGPLAPDHAAAVVRSVATVVDDLHRLGITHGRIEADHIVLSSRGRPRLCGFAEAGDTGDRDPTDDVAALGALLDGLLDEGQKTLWSPEHRGIRSAGRRSRALAGFRRAATTARRDDPAQRPTALQFATALLDALPGLRLPGSTDDATEPGDDATTFAEIPDDVDPTADLGWTADDLLFLSAEDATAEAPDSGGAEGTDDPVTTPTHAPPASPFSEPGRTDAASDDESAAVEAADLTRIPIRTGPEHAPIAPGPGRRHLAVLAGVLLVVGVVAGAAIARSVRPFGGNGASTATATSPAPSADATTTTAPRTPPPVPDGCTAPDVRGPDVDADGCPEPVTLDGRLATVGNVSVELGREGDLVALGDPDCDGEVTPALLRPDTGEIFVFPTWSLDETIEIKPTTIVRGGVAIGTDDGPCGGFTVERSDGSTVAVTR